MSVAFGCVVVMAAVLAQPAAAAPLTATKIRIGDHPGFVRVVVEFTGGRVVPGEVVATDPDPFPDGFVRLPLTHSGVRTTAARVRAQGVFARIGHVPGRITIRLSGADRRFKYAGYVALHTPERLVIDLYKSRPPSDAAEITRGRGGCLTLAAHSVTRTRVTASGRERDLFEHSLVVRLRRTGGADPPPEGRDRVQPAVDHELHLSDGGAADRHARGGRAVGEGRHARLLGPGARAVRRQLRRRRTSTAALGSGRVRAAS